MAIVVLKLPDVKRESLGRPRQCPYCAGVTFQRWEGEEADPGCALAGGMGLSLSLLSLSAHLPTLSFRE